MLELQAHSTVSDGELDPTSVVEAAVAAGVTVLALTDHDAVDGVPEAAEAAARLGVELIGALELSSVHELADDLHVVGYHVDLEAIAPACERAQAERVERAREIVGRLNELGVEVSFEDAIAEAGGAASVGRPHIARAAGATDMNSFFRRYLVPGAAAFVPRRWPTTEQAVEIIRTAGGKAAFAHPFWDLGSAEQVGGILDAISFDAVEVFYPSHTRAETEYLWGECERRGLVPTASSDFHGPANKNFSAFGRYRTYEIGEPRVP